MYFLQTNFLNNKPCLNQVVPGTPKPTIFKWMDGLVISNHFPFAKKSLVNIIQLMLPTIGKKWLDIRFPGWRNVHF